MQSNYHPTWPWPIDEPLPLWPEPGPCPPKKWNFGGQTV